ncbi:MAG: EamA family transporter, partial [Nanoarchaeota archaeon]|nr:EamA family transporter [Nanoarchaeota archaeon]
IYQLFRKPKRTPIGLGKISISALFGAVGTMLIFTAVSLAAASKIYPIGGSTAVFAFIIGTLFLKEKSTWPKAFGVLAVFIGIWLTSM